MAQAPRVIVRDSSYFADTVQQTGKRVYDKRPTPTATEACDIIKYTLASVSLRLSMPAL